MSDAQLIRMYDAGLQMCQLNQGRRPSASFVQQLVQTWRELVRRQRTSPPCYPNLAETEFRSKWSQPRSPRVSKGVYGKSRVPPTPVQLVRKSRTPLNQTQ